VTVTLVALDADGRLVKSYNGTADLSTTDTGATLPQTVTFKNGKASFEVTFAAAGKPTLTATDHANSALTVTATVNVAAPLVATQYVLRVQGDGPRHGRVEAGAPVTVTMAALNADGRLVKSYNGTADLATTDAGATLPESVTFKNGKASFQVTFAAAGQPTLTATDHANSALTVTATVNVAAPAVATQYALRVQGKGPRLGRVQAGVPVTVMLAALDADGRLVKSYNGTADLATTDTEATMPQTVTFKNGKARFQVTFAAAGQPTLTATDHDNPALTATATVNVSAQGTSRSGKLARGRSRWRS
jgi:hypothetical protein